MIGESRYNDNKPTTITRLCAVKKTLMRPAQCVAMSLLVSGAYVMNKLQINYPVFTDTLYGRPPDREGRRW